MSVKEKEEEVREEMQPQVLKPACLEFTARTAVSDLTPLSTAGSTDTDRLASTGCAYQ